VRNSTLDVAGDLTLTADSEARLNATVSNAANTVASALYGASGKSIGGILTSNKVSSAARAFIENTGDAYSVAVGGSLTITAEDHAGIYANTLLVSSTVTSNDRRASTISSRPISRRARALGRSNSASGCDWRTTTTRRWASPAVCTSTWAPRRRWT
jgi:hypothetical protein